MKESSLVVIFEVCALYTAVLLGQLEDVCACCLHSAHLHTHIPRAHTCAVTCSVVVFSINGVFCCFYYNKKEQKRPCEMLVYQCVSVSQFCQSQGKCWWTAGDEVWRARKSITHCEKYRFCTSAAVIKEMLIVDADVNMMCGKVALHFQQPWRSLITRLSDNDSVQQMHVCEIKRWRFEFVIYQWNPFEARIGVSLIWQTSRTLRACLGSVLLHALQVPGRRKTGVSLEEFMSDKLLHYIFFSKKIKKAFKLKHVNFVHVAQL